MDEERQAIRSTLRMAQWDNDNRLWQASRVLGEVRLQGDQFLAVAEDGHVIGTFPTLDIARAIVKHQAGL